MRKEQFDVEKIIELGNLEIPEQELPSFTKDFQNILKFIETLQSIDVSDAVPTHQVHDLENVYRTDDVVPFIHHRSILEMSKNRQGDLFRAPGVFEHKEQSDES